VVGAAAGRVIARPVCLRQPHYAASCFMPHVIEVCPLNARLGRLGAVHPEVVGAPDSIRLCA
jgi:hypothetical protein